MYENIRRADGSTDAKKENEKITELEKRLNNDYAPQLRVYEAALKSIISSDPERSEKKIEKKLYHRFR